MRIAQRRNTGLLRSVVQHELAHVQLGHPRWRQVIAACSVLLFAHPLYWFLARAQREAAELLADDQAAGRIGKTQYVEELINLVEQLRHASLHTSPSGFASLSALGAPEKADGRFYLRMRALIMRSTTLRANLTRCQLISRGLACAALMTGITLALGRPALAQRSSSSPATAEQAAPFMTDVRGTLTYSGDLGHLGPLLGLAAARGVSSAPVITHVRGTLTYSGDLGLLLDLAGGQGAQRSAQVTMAGRGDLTSTRDSTLVPPSHFAVRAERARCELLTDAGVKITATLGRCKLSSARGEIRLEDAQTGSLLVAKRGTTLQVQFTDGQLVSSSPGQTTHTDFKTLSLVVEDGVCANAQIEDCRSVTRPSDSKSAPEAKAKPSTKMK